MSELLFREEEKALLQKFANDPEARAMAVYGRRRTGKTLLLTDFYHASEEKRRCSYYQCTSLDYTVCLKDYIEVLRPLIPDSFVLDRLTSFREVFLHLMEKGISHKIFIIDEFPFLAKKNENVPVEFQWIIDHGLGTNKIILLGSSLSFMKKQIGDREAPLYGRFNKILELMPFSFDNVRTLFPSFEDAVAVYARTGGVAHYVMQYSKYSSIAEADADLFFQPHGSLFQEADNLLMQEVREVTTYASILRAIGSGEKESGQIAEKCEMDPRAVFGYLNKLTDLQIISVRDHPLALKQKAKRYFISDLLYRFHYTFIEPRVSLITIARKDAMPSVLNHQYNEYLGFVYEEIIRNQCFRYGLQGILPFVPFTVGKWWGNIQENGKWVESEVDVIAFDDHHLTVGECKYRNKAVGLKELDELKLKASFIPAKGRELTYLLASRNGFTDDLRSLYDPKVVLIDQI